MLTALVEFIHRLRDVGIPVSMVETLDAMESLRHVDLSSRKALRAALGATLVKRTEHREAFDGLFDLYFTPRRDEPHRPKGGAAVAETSSLTDPAARGAHEAGSQELLLALLDALRQNDEGALRALAARAVQEFAGINAHRTGSARYYAYRVLRQLDLSNLLRRAIQSEHEHADEATAFDERLVRDEHGRRIEEFRRLIAEEIRHRLVEIKGTHEAADMYHPKLIEDVDFLAASPAQLREMRYAIRPLAHKLAARIAHRRRFRRHGRLEIRKTMRRSLSAGGVPLEPAFRYPKVTKPDLYLLCDISGSVAEFARFTMSLLYAMNEEFSKIRSFVFIDGIDEVSEALKDGSTVLEVHHLLARANVVWADGHSDYGNAFARFWSIYGHLALGGKATVIITGDARNNYRDPGVEILRLIKERARKVYWLNPEARSKWDTTDSIMSAYAPHCNGVFEVRNLRQLTNFVQGIV